MLTPTVTLGLQSGYTNTRSLYAVLLSSNNGWIVKAQLQLVSSDCARLGNCRGMHC